MAANYTFQYYDGDGLLIAEMVYICETDASAELWSDWFLPAGTASYEIWDGKRSVRRTRNPDPGIERRVAYCSAISRWENEGGAYN